MIPVHVALVDDTGRVDPVELAVVAGDLNAQIQQDFAPTWQVAATVGAYPKAPAGTWAIHLQARLDDPEALGYHTDENHQPVSHVELTSSWTVSASHELMEMLADPWGARILHARVPDQIANEWRALGLPSPISTVGYLLEPGDPCESVS